MVNHLLRSLLPLSLALVTGVLSAQADSGGMATTRDHRKQLIGYITQWDAWKGADAGLPSEGVFNHLNVDFSKYTMLNWSFFGVAKDGSLHSGDHRNKEIWKEGSVQEPKDLFFLDTDSSWDLPLLFGELDMVQYIDKKVVERAKKQGFEVKENGQTWSNPTWGLKGKLPLPLAKENTQGKGLLALGKEKGVKVLGSIGGWSMCKHIPEVMADATKRKKLVSECQKLIKIGFDGIDLDWEYPGPFKGMNFKGSEADYGNFLTFMKEVREAIGTDKVITACFSADVEKLKGFNWAELAKVMDYFNFMTYDYNGDWSNAAGHNAPVADFPGAENKKFNWDTLLAFLKEKSVDLSKTNMGVPFYGRAVICEGKAAVGAKTKMRKENKQPDGEVTTCSDNVNWGKEYAGAPDYHYILKKATGWTKGFDEAAKTPFMTKNEFFLSYDDEQSVGIKAKYVKDNNMAGVIVWHVFGDMEVSGSVKAFGQLKKYSNVKTSLVNKMNEVFAGYSEE